MRALVPNLHVPLRRRSVVHFGADGRHRIAGMDGEGGSFYDKVGDENSKLVVLDEKLLEVEEPAEV